ncbi:MAG: ABC transporter ATP-binding protein [Halobacteriales archaeon]|nr:ABC transporter ATP-binding protein [Halobacteriales archaeon]
MSLLSVEDLTVTFDAEAGTVHAVDGIDFAVDQGETVCLVGESGSGKTVACEAVTQLLPTPPGEISGTVTFGGEELTTQSERALRDYRGGRIGHIFQNPQDALDPVYTVGSQVVEAIRLHRDDSKAEAKARAIELLDRVGIGNADERFHDYPHEFSGGMTQRVVIAISLACDPDLLIADEPTTALDVTIQAQVLDLLSELQAERDMGTLFVTHDLGVVAEIADRVVVMYAGQVMERGPVEEVFTNPSHPYTTALLDCLPGRGDSSTIEGSLPDPKAPPAGCRFHPRCPHAVPACGHGDAPPFETVGDDHDAACILHRDTYDLPAELGESDE